MDCPTFSAEPVPAPVRVLVVDDQPVVRRGIALMLAMEPGLEVVGQAADGHEALALARATRPDVVLMDLQMPRMDGVAATRAITAELPGPQVVVLTTYDADGLVFDAIRAGAQAYLLKDASDDDVLETIRAVARGESRLAPHIARKVMDEFRRMAPRPLAGQADAAASAAPSETDPAEAGGDELLTKREAEVLQLIADGLSNRDIAQALDLGQGTVKNHVSRIMEKLHARSRTELAVRVLRRRAAAP